MKRTYVTPALLNSGDAVLETLQSTMRGQAEAVNPLIYRPFTAGIGFGL